MTELTAGRTCARASRMKLNQIWNLLQLRKKIQFPARDGAEKSIIQGVCNSLRCVIRVALVPRDSESLEIR